jgi:hypothetical protein
MGIEEVFKELTLINHPSKEHRTCN